MSVFGKAIEILQDKGWCRTLLTGADGQHCVLGALYTAQGLAEDTYARYPDNKEVKFLAEAVWEAMEELGKIPRPYHAPSLVFEWNDQYAQDVDEVIHVMKRAQEIEESA